MGRRRSRHPHGGLKVPTCCPAPRATPSPSGSQADGERGGFVPSALASGKRFPLPSLRARLIGQQLARRRARECVVEAGGKHVPPREGTVHCNCKLQTLVLLVLERCRLPPLRSRAARHTHTHPHTCRQGSDFHDLRCHGCFLPFPICGSCCWDKPRALGPKQGWFHPTFFWFSRTIVLSSRAPTIRSSGGHSPARFRPLLLLQDERREKTNRSWALSSENLRGG